MTPNKLASLAARRNFNVNSSHNHKGPQQAMTKSVSDSMRVRQAIERRQALELQQQSMNASHKQSQLVYKITPQELSKMSHNLSNFASLFEEEGAPFGELSDSYPDHQ